MYHWNITIQVRDDTNLLIAHSGVTLPSEHEPTDADRERLRELVDVAAEPLKALLTPYLNVHQ